MMIWPRKTTMYPFVRGCHMLHACAMFVMIGDDYDDQPFLIMPKTGGFDDIIKEDVTTTYPFVRGWRMLNQQI